MKCIFFKEVVEFRFKFRIVSVGSSTGLVQIGNRSHHAGISTRLHCRGRHATLQWRHNDHDGVSNHQPHDCLLSRLFRHKWKKTSKLRVTGPCAGNSPATGEFPEQKASDAEMFPFDDAIMKSARGIWLYLIAWCCFYCIARQMLTRQWLLPERLSSLGRHGDEWMLLKGGNFSTNSRIYWKEIWIT